MNNSLSEFGSVFKLLSRSHRDVTKKFAITNLKYQLWQKNRKFKICIPNKFWLIAFLALKNENTLSIDKQIAEFNFAIFFVKMPQ